ncbi:MAG: folate family ECF transporter S component [Clostridia bacterium]|nr:folate family ECF transporter S component [Clostridia bacterium]
MKKKAKAFSSVKVLTTGAMLTALSIVIGIFCKNYLNFGNGLFRVTFENFPIILSGILFGPVVGALVGVCSDVLSYVLSTQSLAISPLVTLGAAAVGAVSGLISHYVVKKGGYLRLLISAVAAHLTGSILIKSIGLFAYYGIAVLWRIPVYAGIVILESLLIHLMYQNSAFRQFFQWK